MPLQGARGEGDAQLWGSGRGAIAGCQRTNFGVVDVVPLQGARGEGDDQLWGVDVVPFLGAI